MRGRLPEGTFMAIIDDALAIQDYASRRDCIRLVAVSEPSFRHQRFNDPHGCETFIIDIALRHFLRNFFHYLPSNAKHQRLIFEFLTEDLATRWFEIHFSPSIGPSESYAYPAFSPDGEPTYIDIKSISLTYGPGIKPPPDAQSFPQPSSLGSRFDLHAFHVGQGMCSLLSNDIDGYVIDIGAGKPVFRDDYRANLHKATNAPFINQLRTALNPLQTINVILSHPDGDHWRILDWDNQLLNAVDGIYLPHGVPALVFRAPPVVNKVWGISDFDITHTGTKILRARRSSPTHPDRNGQCLVCAANVNGRTALLPGDYVYERMATDGHTDISGWANCSFDAVVVPHHGDKRSAKVLPQPSNPHLSKAFFSAGTNIRYKHPTKPSRDAHKARWFQERCNNTWDDIIQFQLI